jgi:hypothetical protein
MLRTTLVTAELAIPTLVNTIKAHLTKAAQAADKSEQHYVTAGLRLKELKARKPSATPWPEYVRETFGLGRERERELIRIADGRTTVEKVRAGGAARAAKNIAKLKSGVANTGPGLKPNEFQRLDGRVEANDSDKVSPEVKAAADDAGLTSKQRLTISRLPDEAEQLKSIAKMAAINIVADRTEKAAAAKSAKPMADVARAADRTEPEGGHPMNDDPVVDGRAAANAIREAIETIVAARATPSDFWTAFDKPGLRADTLKFIEGAVYRLTDIRNGLMPADSGAANQGNPDDDEA